MAWFQAHFFSHSLGLCVSAQVLIPQLPAGEAHNFPVLTLLHGMSDDDTIWLRRTSIERYAENRGLAVIMPAGNLSWYTDMASGPRYFTYISEELPVLMRQFFPSLSSQREDNYIAGLSMGGYGALKIALTYPERYAGVISLSGALDVRSRAEFWPNKLHDSIFGTGDFKDENDVFALAVKAITSGDPVPRIFLRCGTEDGLIHQNRRFNRTLLDAGYSADYGEAPGNHNWDFWDTHILEGLNSVISSANKSI